MWIANVEEHDHKREYVCIASRRFYLETGSLIDHEIGAKIILNVIEPETDVADSAPLAIHTIENIEVVESTDNLRIPCIFKGHPAVNEVSWFKNDEEYNTSDTMVLTFLSAEAYHSGDYTCKVSNGIGEEIEHITTVTIGSKPRYRDNTDLNLISTTGETKTIFCNVTGIPEPSIEWFFNARPISEAPINGRRTIYENNITITDVQDSDNFGVYGCRATNKYGSVYKEYSIIVSDRPVIHRDYTQEFIVVRGSKHTFHCSVLEHSINVTFTWFHNNTIINKCSEYSINTDGSLFIPLVTYQNAGEQAINLVVVVHG